MITHADRNAGNLSRCRVLIADDHGVVRLAFRHLLETTDTANVVGEAANGEDAVSRIRELEPDVAVVDLNMPKMDGIAVTRDIAAGGQKTRILAVSGLDDGQTICDVLTAGATGYLPKSAAGEDLLTAVRMVAAGEPYVHGSVVEKVLRLDLQPLPGQIALSEQETVILRCIAHGYSNKEIAAKLSLGVKSVETYKARGMKKLNVTSKVGIVRYGMSSGWFKLGGSTPFDKPSASGPFLGRPNFRQ